VSWPFLDDDRDASPPITQEVRARTGDDALHDLLVSLEIYGALEGLAARWAAERGISALQLGAVQDCLKSIDDLIRVFKFSNGSLAQFLVLNARFHGLVMEAVQCRTLTQYTEKPPQSFFAHPRANQIWASDPKKLHAVLIIEQDQHHAIIEAIENGMGARAESLVREHFLLGRRQLLGSSDQRALRQV
jgi:GntR family transcriptional regulator, vanillate catabolism transcriptional regulator